MAGSRRPRPPSQRPCRHATQPCSHHPGTQQEPNLLSILNLFRDIFPAACCALMMEHEQLYPQEPQCHGIAVSSGVSGKYRRAVIDPEVDQALRNVCLDIEARYEIKFLEIGTDKDHVHFLVQSVPMYSVKKIVQVIKSITAREVFQRCPHVKKRLWGGEFWSDGYFASTGGEAWRRGEDRKVRAEPGTDVQKTS